MHWICELDHAADSVAITFPPEMAERMGLRDGDAFVVIQTEAGILLQRDDHHAAMEAFDDVRTHYRNTLRRLDD